MPMWTALLDLSAEDLLPLAVLIVVIFLLKTGAVVAIGTGIKKLWQKLRDKKKTDA